jgi:hypothetical protein
MKNFLTGFEFLQTCLQTHFQKSLFHKELSIDGETSSVSKSHEGYQSYPLRNGPEISFSSVQFTQFAEIFG